MAAKVTVAPWNQIYVELFNLLTSSRSTGPGGPLPLVLSEIKAGLELFGLTGPEERIEAAGILQAMDRVWLEVARRKAEEAIEREQARRQRDAERAIRRPRGRRRAS